MIRTILPALLAILIASSPAAAADRWRLDTKRSHVTFAMIDEDGGIVYHLVSDMFGWIERDGSLGMEVDPATVQALVPQRDSSSGSRLFEEGVTFVGLGANLDPQALSSMALGGFDTVETTVDLLIDGDATERKADVLVAHLRKGQLLVKTEMLMTPPPTGIRTPEDGRPRSLDASLRLFFEREVGPDDVPEIVASIGDGGNAGDAKAGQKVFRTCMICHSITEPRNRIGPHLIGILGRKAGSVEDYRYSSAMRRSGIVWTPLELTRYLVDPKGTVPGTTMSFAGLRKQKDVVDLLAYLGEAGE